MDVISVRVHAIPDGHDAKENHGKNDIERGEGTPTQAPEGTTGKRHRGERSGGDYDSLFENQERFEEKEKRGEGGNNVRKEIGTGRGGGSHNQE